MLLFSKIKKGHSNRLYKGHCSNLTNTITLFYSLHYLVLDCVPTAEEPTMHADPVYSYSTARTQETGDRWDFTYWCFHLHWFQLCLWLPAQRMMGKEADAHSHSPAAATLLPAPNPWSSANHWGGRPSRSVGGDAASTGCSMKRC